MKVWMRKGENQLKISKEENKIIEKHRLKLKNNLKDESNFLIKKWNKRNKDKMFGQRFWRELG